MKIGILGVALALVAGCTSVRTTRSPTANLAQYRTFAFQPGEQTLDRSPTGAVIRDQVTANLGARGVVPAASNTPPDLLVSYGLTMQQVSDWAPYPGWWGWDGWGYGYGYGFWDPYTYTQGTLSINMTDARTGQVVWRGTAVKPVAHPENPGSKGVAKSVDKVMSRYRM